MKHPWSDLVKVDFGLFGRKWNQSDKLVLLIYDASLHQFGQFRQSYVDHLLKASPAGLTVFQNRPELMASKVFKDCTSEMSVKSTDFVSSYEYQGSNHNRYQRRHYVLVAGKNFSLLTKSGFQTFDHQADLVSALGQPNGTVFDQILTNRFPQLRRQVAEFHLVMKAG